MPPPRPDEWRFVSEGSTEIATRAETAVAALARRRRGLVTRADLRACGVSDATIAEWIRRGRLVRIHRGVYAYGHASLTAEGRWLAAVLACGPGAVLSHRSAAAAWALLPSARSRFDVIVAGAGGRELPLVDAHRCRLRPDDRTELGGLPITTPMRTLVDLAAVVSPARLERAVEAAERLGSLDLRAVDAILARTPRRRGAAALRAALAAHRPEHAWTRSGIERAALALVERAGLPRPQVNTVVAGHEVDLCWPEARLVAELDTTAFHGTVAAFHRDRARDAELAVAGWRVVRLSDRQLAGDPDAVAATLRALLRPPDARRTRARA